MDNLNHVTVEEAERLKRLNRQLVETNKALTREVATQHDELNRLKETAELFDETLRLSRTGSFITDVDSDNHQWSEEARRIFGFAPDETISLKKIRDHVHPDDLAHFDEGAERAVRVGHGTPWPFRTLSNGVVRHARVAVHVVRRNGRQSFVGALQDMTDQKLAEAALDRARTELAHVSRVASLGVLTASIAHEVNQPLSAILTNANTCQRMLTRQPPNIEGASETARRTVRDAQRASEVVTRLRALFGKKEFVVASFDLNAAAQEVLALSAHELQRHRVAVSTDFDRTLPEIHGDRVQIQQVILNFLLNASDALQQVDLDKRRVWVASRSEGSDAVQLSVRDNGPGFTEGAETKLFDAFYTTKPHGMGIGLSVSFSIVERHGGRLWASRNADTGATFGFSLSCIPHHGAASR